MFRIIQKILEKRMSSNEFAKKVGVKYGKNPQFRTKNFGTEPYLIEVGDDFETSGNVTFITHDGSVGVLRNLYEEYHDIDIVDKISIGNNVFLGMNVIVLAGTEIGDNVVVGAGSIVRGTLKSNSVYAGVPVKYICSIEEYKDKFLHTFSMNADDKKALIQEKFNIRES